MCESLPSGSCVLTILIILWSSLLACVYVRLLVEGEQVILDAYVEACVDIDDAEFSMMLPEIDEYPVAGPCGDPSCVCTRALQLQGKGLDL